MVLLAIVFAFTFALPVLVVIGSMPSGLISAFIILIGMRQAWSLTAPLRLDVSGPFAIGPRDPVAAA